MLASFLSYLIGLIISSPVKIATVVDPLATSDLRMTVLGLTLHARFHHFTLDHALLVVILPGASKMDYDA